MRHSVEAFLRTAVRWSGFYEEATRSNLQQAEALQRRPRRSFEALEIQREIETRFCKKKHDGS